MQDDSTYPPPEIDHSQWVLFEGTLDELRQEPDLLVVQVAPGSWREYVPRAGRADKAQR